MNFGYRQILIRFLLLSTTTFSSVTRPDASATTSPL
jgi:hypothetical protein